MSINTPEAIKNFALKRWDKLAAKKYDAGQAAHGGLITERDSIADLEEEIIDAWTNHATQVLNNPKATQSEVKCAIIGVQSFSPELTEKLKRKKWHKLKEL